MSRDQDHESDIRAKQLNDSRLGVRSFASRNGVEVLLVRVSRQSFPLDSLFGGIALNHELLR